MTVVLKCNWNLYMLLTRSCRNVGTGYLPVQTGPVELSIHEGKWKNNSSFGFEYVSASWILQVYGSSIIQLANSHYSKTSLNRLQAAK